MFHVSYSSIFRKKCRVLSGDCWRGSGLHQIVGVQIRNPAVLVHVGPTFSYSCHDNGKPNSPFFFKKRTFYHQGLWSFLLHQLLTGMLWKFTWQFFLELMKVPQVESKLRVFSFKIQFKSQVWQCLY